MSDSAEGKSWLNRTVLGVGLTSLLSDWSHEAATAILPAFLAVIGAGPAWLGAIEGISDGLSSFTKLAAGHYTDRWKKRKPIAVFGYAVTAIATATFAFTTHAYQLVIACHWLAWPRCALAGKKSVAYRGYSAVGVRPRLRPRTVDGHRRRDCRTDFRALAS